MNAKTRILAFLLGKEGASLLSGPLMLKHPCFFPFSNVGSLRDRVHSGRHRMYGYSVGTGGRCCGMASQGSRNSLAMDCRPRCLDSFC